MKLHLIVRNPTFRVRSQARALRRDYEGLRHQTQRSCAIGIRCQDTIWSMGIVAGWGVRKMLRFETECESPLVNVTGFSRDRAIQELAA